MIVLVHTVLKVGLGDEKMLSVLEESIGHCNLERASA